MFSSHPIKILTNISGKQCDNKRITINMKLVQYYSFGKNPTLHIVRCNIAQSNWKPQIKLY